MIQFNLLPDLKLEYIKAERTKKMLTTISLSAAFAAVGLMLMSFFIVNVVQKARINSLNSKALEYTREIQSIKDINKLLTVQKQLASLNSLHQLKPETSRIFDYLSQVTPENVYLNNFSIDYATNTITLGGEAPKIDTIRVYADTLKGTRFTVNDGTDKKYAFNQVELSSFSKADDKAPFTITLKYDQSLFTITNSIKLEVPKGPKTSQDRLFSSEGV